MKNRHGNGTSSITSTKISSVNSGTHISMTFHNIADATYAGGVVLVGEIRCSVKECHCLPFCPQGSSLVAIASCGF